MNPIKDLALGNLTIYVELRVVNRCSNEPQIEKTKVRLTSICRTTEKAAAMFVEKQREVYPECWGVWKSVSVL